MGARLRTEGEVWGVRQCADPQTLDRPYHVRTSRSRSRSLVDLLNDKITYAYEA